MTDMTQTNPCACATCPGTSCICGCQTGASQAATQSACACGPQCRCGQGCTCRQS